MSYIEKEKLIKADMDSIENIVRHAFNQGYDLGFKDGKKSAKPQEPQTFKWCDTCKEYDQEKHCCRRWSKVIRDTVEEMKQEYIEREVLDKIRAEIEKEADTSNRLQGISEIGLRKALKIIDKYKAENGNDD